MEVRLSDILKRSGDFLAHVTRICDLGQKNSFKQMRPFIAAGKSYTTTESKS